MAMTGKEYQLAIRIAGIIDKSFNSSLTLANTSLKSTVASVNSDFTKLDKGFNSVMKVGKTCFRAVATAATVAATAVGTVVAASVSVGSEFEKQMSTVESISGATSEQMELLSARARELAQSTVFSAEEVGQAMEYMGMAGWKTEEMLAGIGGVLDLAAASGEDLATVSDIVTDDLTAFHMTADETQRMVDVMAQAAMNSNTNVKMMGDTFKYAGTVAGTMGYSIEDMAIATGLMASSSIKSTEAGTALRSIITRMVKPTKESAEAMSALGLSLEKSDGSMYSFYEIMQKIREGMSGMTKVQKTYYARELAGQRAMTGLLAIADASDEQFEQLTESIYNAEGAAQKMSEIRLDNLAGDVEIFRDALSDAGIELYYQFNDQLRDVVQFGTSVVDSAKVKIPAAFQTVSAEFPTLQRKFQKYAEPVFDTVLDTGKWLVKHGDGVISVLAGIGGTLAAYKAASTGVHALNWIMNLSKLNKVTWIILGLTAAIGTVTAGIAAYKQYVRDLTNENLETHFGNIALSMEDLQSAAEHIVSTESLEGVREALEAFEDLDQIESELENVVKTIDKMNWKVSIGIELSEEENEEYQTSIQEYVSAAQKYVEQTGYAVSLNLKVGLGDSEEGIAVSEKINQFYLDSYDEMVILGQELSDAVNQAFSDNVLDPEEITSIAEIQSKMAELQKSLATSEFDAQLSLLGQKFGGNLTADSFQNLQNEINNQVEEATKSYDDAYAKNYAGIQAAYAAGEYLSNEEYQNAIDLLNQTYLADVSELRMKGINFQLQTIFGQYADELGETQKIELEEAIAGINEYDWENAPEESYAQMYSLFDSILKSGNSTGASAKAVSELLENMEPSMEQLETLRLRYEELGMGMSEAMLEGFYNYNLLKTLSEGSGMSGESGSYLLGLELGKSGLWESDFAKIFGEHPATYGEYIEQGALEAAAAVSAESIQKAADSTVEPAVEGIYAWSKEKLDEYFAKGFKTNADVEILLNPKMNAFAFSGLSGIGHRANGGLATSPELTWFAERSPEMAIPIDGSSNAISLWEQTGKLLGMDSVLDHVDLEGGSGTVIEYKPTLQFYGGTPSREDLDDAMEMSQDKFDLMMDRYFKTHGRLAF